MEVNRDYPEEITSLRANKGYGQDVLNLSKKRKFVGESNEEISMQVSKHIRYLPQQANVIYANTREGKEPLNELDNDTHSQIESMQDSNSITGESFSVSSFHSGEPYEGDRFCEENLDEFGHCLTYLASACGKQHKDEELEELLYSNGLIVKSCQISSGSFSVQQETHFSTGGTTIDQEFEQYFSTLML